MTPELISFLEKSVVLLAYATPSAIARVALQFLLDQKPENPTILTLIRTACLLVLCLTGAVATAHLCAEIGYISNYEKTVAGAMGFLGLDIGIFILARMERYRARPHEAVRDLLSFLRRGPAHPEFPPPSNPNPNSEPSKKHE